MDENHFEGYNLDFYKKNSGNVSNFWQIFSRKLGPIKQHKPKISDYSFLKMQ